MTDRLQDACRKAQTESDRLDAIYYAHRNSEGQCLANRVADAFPAIGDAGRMFVGVDMAQPGSHDYTATVLSKRDADGSVRVIGVWRGEN